MCVSLRLNPETLKELEQKRDDRTLSTTMNVRICGALSALSHNAKKEVNDG
jgi:hypothetical protein